VVDCRAKSLI